MDFNANKPIYQQITDYCYGRIIAGAWIADGRIPSVKELSVEMTVNNRTVLKAYDDLQADGVIYQKRGLGYFVAPDACDRIRERQRAEFFSTTVPELKRQMTLLGISADELAAHLK